MIYRRQRQQYIFAIFLTVVFVVNVLFYFILTRPSQTEYARLQSDIRQLQSQAVNSRKYFNALSQNAGKLENFDRDKNALLMMHLVNRNKGYSEIQNKLQSIVQKSGVKYTSKRYNINPTPQAGLYSVSIAVPVEGSYSSVVSFIRDLENSDTFFLITSISVERAAPSTGQPGQPGQPGQAVAFNNNVSNNTNAAAANGSVSLSLTLETYFYQ